MRFNVICKSFRNAALAVSKVVSSKNTLNILENFLIEVKGQQLYITGSDSDCTLSSHVDLTECDGEISFCVSARRLVDLLKVLPDQGITFDVNPETFEMEIQSPDGLYHLNAISGDSFPSFSVEEADAENAATFSLSARSIAEGCHATVFAVGNDDYRPMMKGVYFDVKPDQIVYVATDTHTLVRFIDSREQPGVQVSCIVPEKPANIMSQIFEGCDDTVQFTINRKSAMVENGSYKFQFSFVQGRFPDYNRVIPQQSPYLLEADKDAFSAAMRRVSIISDTNSGLVKFKISPENVMVKIEDNGIGAAGREQFACSYNGPELIIGFNGSFVIDFLAHIATDQVRVELADASRAGVFRPIEDAEGTNLVMLLMPMNVDKF